jgi:hypothetical protein
MTPHRRRFLDENPTAQLTAEELAEGWRFCPERDGHLAHRKELRHVCEHCECAPGLQDTEG